MSQDRYLPLDEDGYFWFDGTKLEDPAVGGELLRALSVDPKGQVMTALNGQSAFVEAFDAPLVVRHVAKGSGQLIRLDLPYNETATADCAGLSLDQWDRFHGVTTAGLPFVLSRSAQFEFFNLVEDFDDDSITINQTRLNVPGWLKTNPVAGENNFWNQLYQAEDTRWDLGREAPALNSILPQLKLVKQRILVLGAGAGHDAAYLARQGHAVTAVDFSAEAVGRARALYGHVEGLRFVRDDVFDLPPEFTGGFDVVFEHTLYCAIEPTRRDDLVRVWTKVLTPRGHLIGVFFVTERDQGPPFGGSEWEVRQRLRPSFQSIYWTRWRHSEDSRRGRELVVYANRRD